MGDDSGKLQRHPTTSSQITFTSAPTSLEWGDTDCIVRGVSAIQIWQVELLKCETW